MGNSLSKPKPLKKCVRGHCLALFCNSRSNASRPIICRLTVHIVCLLVITYKFFKSFLWVHIQIYSGMIFFGDYNNSFTDVHFSWGYKLFLCSCENKVIDLQTIHLQEVVCKSVIHRKSFIGERINEQNLFSELI